MATAALSDGTCRITSLGSLFKVRLLEANNLLLLTERSACPMCNLLFIFFINSAT